ncbi:hypothetical protein M409DRAFT_59363 [Zasmidium cellare ATCC 36951]|uniref:Uncharacterized protein n=1 Tax=Zasmidium cellare ATCC 36951 TaxID=1080233 RepID=A0A6A6C5E7_ZASCE|nr:uncharacterized protein M409DRAFT_59363 [Zasmidium cellare ATCC 36951]KAF2161092.1 hypothetical protein M409DRAFT_59363 [Zasmidium cellare ATCC 36951]
MSDLTMKLHEASSKNQSLLSELTATDHAPSSLKQNTTYITDLKSQITSTDKELARLHAITEDERKDHIKYRDSTLKRYAFKLGGSKGQDKFASRQEKEEKEFLAAWQSERSAKESREELATALANAENQEAQLQKDAERHAKAQKALDELYEGIFAGPTPDVSGEDGAEESVGRCKAHFEGCQEQLGREKQAAQALERAEQALKAGYGDIQDALRRSTRDMFGGGTFTDMMERDALSKAQNNMHSVIRHMDAAQHLQPSIKPLSDITIDQGHMFSDVLFDNIFTDMAQHERIQQSEAQMVQALQQLKQQIGEQRQRVGYADQRVQGAVGELEKVRGELQRIRAEAFERVVGGGVAGNGVEAAAPPAYAV